MKSPYLGAVVVYHGPQSGQPIPGIVIKVHNPQWVALKTWTAEGYDFFIGHAEWGLDVNFPQEPPDSPTMLGPLDWSGIG